MSLNFYFDTANIIAREFAIFSDNDPVWNKFSGIDTNVPLLSTYVIGPSEQIISDYIEQNSKVASLPKIYWLPCKIKYGCASGIRTCQIPIADV